MINNDIPGDRREAVLMRMLSKGLRGSIVRYETIYKDAQIIMVSIITINLRLGHAQFK